MSDRELTDVLIFLFVAGYDTSKNMLTLMMRLLVDAPDANRRCASDPDYARKAVEEAFRVHGTASIQRVLLEDVEYRDVVLEKDAILWFPISVATHDARYADAPARFDPERPRGATHLGFGLGAHMCLGQYIARAQIAEGIQLIAQRLANPRTTGETGYRPFPGVWGLKGLPISFDPAPARH